jgi:DNA transposition AAA+ family ATPase
MSAATETNGAKPSTELAPPIDRSLQAEASSAHSRINIPLNLTNWRALPNDVAEELLWFHQWILDNNLTWDEAADAIGYDRSYVFKILKGYGDAQNWRPNWKRIIEAIRKYRWQQKKTQQHIEFGENSITQRICDSFRYATANHCITVVETESRMGKTYTAVHWSQQDQNNHGKTIFVTAPVVGGVAALIRLVGKRCGINAGGSTNNIAASVYSAFNRSRHLIVDEAHRLFPNDLRVVNPQKIEFLRDLHDQTGCAITLLVTARFRYAIKKGSYQYEQLVGRSKFTQIKPVITKEDIEPIVRQFVKLRSKELMEKLTRIANEAGRLGVLTEVLRAARRAADSDKEPVGAVHIEEAIALRAENAGDFAK